MVKFHSKSELPYTAFQLRDLIMDVESYPLFIPNCLAVEIVESDSDLSAEENGIIPKPILNQANEFKGESAECTSVHEHRRDPQNSFASFKMGNGIILADMAISYKGLVESYRSKIYMAINSPEQVEIYVEAISGPFKHLKTSWVINQHNKSSIINFTIDFSFKSHILNKLMTSVLENTARDMLLAFEGRAKKLFEK